MKTKYFLLVPLFSFVVHIDAYCQGNEYGELIYTEGYELPRSNMEEPNQKVKKLDDFAAMLLGVEVGSQAESKTFDLGTILIKSKNGKLVWTMANIKVTYIRVQNNDPTKTVCYVTIGMEQSSNNSYLEKGGGLALISLNANGGVLENWDIGQLDGRCKYKNATKTYQKYFSPDWYDIAAKPKLSISPCYWHQCE
jgi:hypothetical protein